MLRASTHYSGHPNPNPQISNVGRTNQTNLTTKQLSSGGAGGEGRSTPCTQQEFSICQEFEVAKGDVERCGIDGACAGPRKAKMDFI